MKKGFTLVELIVVITIVTILSTIGFVAYTDYLVGVRDSNRIQQVSKIHNAMELYTTRQSIPLDSDGKTIEYAGSLIGFQGNVNQSILDSLKYVEGGKDPGTKEFFTYFASSDRKKTQVLTFLEKSQNNYIYTSSLYASYEDLTPYVVGSELGVLIESDTNIPLHKSINYIDVSVIDIALSTENISALLSNSRTLNNTNDDLVGIIPNSNCKSHKTLLPSAQNGLYIINPSGSNAFQVYCNMELDGGGWTLVARSHINGLSEGFGWMVQGGDVQNDTMPYSLGSESKKLNFSEIMLADYSNGKEIDHALSFEVSDILYIQDESRYTGNSYSVSGSCKELYPSTTWASACDYEGGTWYYIRAWGFIDYADFEVSSGYSESGHRKEGYFFRYYTVPTTTDGKPLNVSGLRYDGFNANVEGDLAGKPGMIFVR